MAAGNDTVNIKVKYIPDTSALKNIKEIKMPEIKVGGKDAGKGVFDSYNNAIRDLNRELSKGTDASAITKAFKTVGEETTKVKSQINSMKEAINQSFQSSSNQSLIKDYQNLEKQLKKLDAESQKRRKKSSELSSFKSQNNMSTPQARKEISKADALVAAGEKLSKQDQERLEIAKQIVAQEEELAKLKTQEEIRNAQKDIKNQMSDSKYETMITSADANRALSQYNDILSRLGINLNNVTGESKKFSSSLDEQAAQVKAAKKEVTKFGDIISGTFLGTSLSNLFQTGLNRGIEFFKEYDETLTRTMMVTGQTREEVNSLTSSYNKLANQLSSTTKDVAAAQLVFYQQGLGTSEALKMTEASIAVSKTGGIDAAEAADRLTAAVRGYQLSANEAMDIADKMSALDAAAASSVDELTVAMQKSASQARMAGLDLDYYMAYLSTMQEVTREAPENIGTAMKSITSRLQEIKDIGAIEEDGTTFSNVAKALNSIGIAATDSSGQLRTLQDIMNELGPMWNTLDRNHKAYVATVLAGNRQQSRFIALMDNYDRAMELVNVSQNANGESAKQLRAYNQGLEASFTRLNNAWQQLATNIADSSVIKKIIDLFSTFVEVLNKIPKRITSTVVPLLALTKVFTTLSKAGNLFKGFKTWSIEKLGLKDVSKDIGSLGNSFQEVSKTANLAWNSVKRFIDGLGNDKYVKDMNQAIKENTEATDANRVKRLESESSKISEQKSSVLLSSTEDALTTSYNLLTESIKKNEEALQSNDDEMLLEQNDAYKVAKSNLSWATANENQIKKQINDVSENFRLNKMRKLDEEKSLATSSKHGNSLIKQYLESTGMDTKGLRVSQQMFDDNYEKAKKWLKDKTNKEISELAEQAQADAMRLVEEAEEAKKRTDEIRKELAQIRKDSGYSYNKEDLPQKKNSTKFFDTFQKKETVSLGDVKTLFTEDKNIGNFDKISALFNKINISSGLVAGSLTQMGASFLGLDDDMSSALSTGVGLATTFGKFAPPWGAIIGASIGVIKFTFDKLWPSVETTQKKLTELQQEMDELSQKKDTIKNSLKVYEELSGKLDKTDEETQNLKDSTEELVKLIPGIVTGYNQYGEAVINTALAYDELNKKQKELSANADKQLVEFDNLQKGAQKTAKTWNTINKIIGWTLTIGGAALVPFTGGASLYGTAAGLAMVGGGAIADEKIDEKQLEENRKVWDENYSEILSSYQTKRQEFINDIADENKDTATKIVDSFITSIMDAGRDGRITNATDAINDLLGNLTDVSWSEIDNAMASLDEVSKYIKNMTFADAKELLNKQLKQSLKDAGLTDVQIEGVITATLNVAWDGAAEVEALKKSIQTEISNLRNGGGDQSRIPYLEAFSKELDDLTQEEQTLLKNAGMLDTAFTEVFEKNGGVKHVISSFRDSNGELNKSRAIISAINTLLGEQEVQQDKISEYEEKNKQEKENYLKKLKEVAESEAESFSFRNDDEKNKWIEDRYNRLASIDWNDENDGITYESEVLSSQQNKVKNAWEQYNSAIESNNKIIKESKNNINDYKNSITDMTSKIESYAVPTFNELSEQIGKMKESWDSFLSLTSHLDDTNGILDVDGITQLFDLLGSFEGQAFETQEEFDAWMHAIESVNDGLSMENGELQLNAEAMGGINDLISYSTRLKANDMLMTIERGKAELLNQKEVLQAQKEAVDAEIAKIEQMSDAEYQSLVDNGELQKDFKADYIKLLDQTNMHEIDAEENKLTSMIQMQNNYFKQIAAMRTAYANGEDIGDVKWMDIKGEYSKVYDKFVNDSADTFSNLITKSKEKTLASLKEYSSSLGQQISNLDQRINNEVKLKETIADYLNSDKTNLGKAFGDNSQEDVSDYNEKLERTLTLLEKIEGLQHKIDENETFKDLYKDYSGEDYGRLIMTNLDLAQQQYDVYKDLFDMQQEMTNQAAGDLLDSPYGQMFKIEENGDIGWADLTMYDKYKNMPADMKEDIDNLVDAYQNQRDALRDTEKDLAKYAQEVKKVREELVQMQIEIENELVDAIKNREKILHDARVKALDDEIDMIEKAVEARKKAQEDDNSNKELYKAQEALRRATLDSSGKNNAQLLQLQQDLEDKQLEIAEKRFEDDMDDRKQWLQDTKDAESETYDYRLEKMTWYWEQVQAIQEEGTEAMMETLIHWNEEYRQQSALQQSEMEREWKETMDAMKAATDMGAELGKLTSDIVSVTQTVEAMDIKIQALPGSWQKATDAANAYSAAASRASSYKPSSYSGNSGGGDSGSPTTEPKKKVEDKYTGNMKKGDKIEFKPAGGNGTVVATYNSSGVSNGSINDPVGYDRNYTAGDIKKINGEWMVNIGGNQYVPVYHFQKQGTWGNGKHYYASGGMVDYTGPAWVDGNKTHPEAFLSAYQTEQIGALAKSLDPSTVNNATTNSNITFGSINFNVASMSSAADGKKALDVFVQGANDMMAKKGIGTKLNINMK